MTEDQRWAIYIGSGVIVVLIIVVVALTTPADQSSTSPHHHRSAISRRAESSAGDLCATASIRQLARTYGGDVSDPSSVAAAFARASYRPSQRDVAQASCLAALGP
jgi:hypothetical protein